ncbi:hypothetical protein QP991_05795 [Corynebacterium amycolatum]|nr:hypothetical protein [Corynebacterium amycolatum]MDK8819035.1 hypothetical protein [Corynebacterium amycolatum]
MAGVAVVDDVGALVGVIVGHGWFFSLLGSCRFLVVLWLPVCSVEFSCPDAAAFFWGSVGGYVVACAAGGAAAA